MSLSYKERVKIFYKIALGIQYLKELNLVHSDLKEQNVMLDQNLEPKIIDFGGTGEVGSFQHTATFFYKDLIQYKNELLNNYKEYSK